MNETMSPHTQLPNHRHVFHHTARILLVALTFGMAAATVFVLVDVVFHKGGFASLIVVFGAMLVVPSAKAYGRAIEEKSEMKCVVCEQ